MDHRTIAELLPPFNGTQRTEHPQARTCVRLNAQGNYRQRKVNCAEVHHGIHSSYRKKWIGNRRALPGMNSYWTYFLNYSNEALITYYLGILFI